VEEYKNWKTDLSCKLNIANKKSSFKELDRPVNSATNPPY